MLALYLAGCVDPVSSPEGGHRHETSADYAFTEEDGAFLARSPVTRQKIRVDGDGAHVQSGGLVVRLGEGGIPALGACETGGPGGRVGSHGACVRRVEFDRGDVVEWWENPVDGVRQGFTVRAGGDTVTLEVPVSGAAVRLSGERSAIFAGRGRRLRYDGLRAWDADGLELDAHLEAMTGGLRIVVDTAAARFPVTVDPQIHGDIRISGYSSGTTDDWGDAIALPTAVGTGDMNGDGWPDVAVGAWDGDDVFIYAGTADGPGTSYSWSLGVSSADFGREVVWLGDVNNDGYDDLAVASYSYSTNRGYVWIFHGSLTGPASTANRTLSGSASSTYFGAHIAAAGDVDNDGYADIVIGNNNGGGWLYRGSSSGIGSTATSTFTSATGDGAVIGLGDVNADGYDDIAYSGTTYDDGQTDEGEVFVRYGSASGVAASTSWSWDSDTTSAKCGDALAAGDFDGDGMPDLAVSCVYFDAGQTDEGRVYVVYNDGGGLDTGDTSYVESNVASAYFGGVLAAGDVNGDGIDDLAVSSSSYASNDGAIWLYAGSTGGIGIAGSYLTGTATDGLFGTALGLADMDGDGFGDLAVSAPDSDGGYGRVTIFRGSTDLIDAAPYREEDQLWENGTTSYYVGRYLEAAGDLNGDGYADAIGKIGSSSAYLYAFYGGPGGIADAESVGSHSGTVMSALGDVNGDGYDDVAIADPVAESGQTDEGLISVYYGSAAGLTSTGSATLQANQTYAYCGQSVSGAGDVNHDGYDDVVYGCYGYDGGQTDEGRVYLHYGAAAGVSAGSAWSTELNQDSALFGYGVAGDLDVNGDGHPDLVVTAYMYESGENEEGGTFLYLGDGTDYASTAAWSFETNTVSARMLAPASMGDVNGDGYDDFSAASSSSARTYGFYGGSSGPSTGADWTYSGAGTLEPVGDFDGDAYPDVVVGYGTDTDVFRYEGVARLYRGGAAGLESDATRTWRGEQANAYLGNGFCGADLDGDGLSDVLLGMYGYDDPTTDEGAILVDLGEGVDGDEDGYDSTDDCDDVDAAVFPGAEELCDGVDNDCDGVVDDERPRWYSDADADGYGDPGSSTQSCAQPAGTVGNADDCDDASATMFPGAAEICNDLDDDCDGGIDEAGATGARSYYLDADGDAYGAGAVAGASCTAPAGYAGSATDCDDGDPAVFPGASEACNAVDDDCDGELDEGSPDDAAPFYADADDDGFGDAASTLAACDAPAGFVSNDEDCDDGAAAVSPAGVERCNGTDDDCDAAIDEPEAVDAEIWYADGDTDGYGDPAVTTPGCAAPVGYVADATDCDDALATVSPADAERCNGADDDCDGAVDEAGASGESTWYADADADGYGDAAATARACDQPGAYVSGATDCDDAAAAVHPSGTELCNGVDDDCDGGADEGPPGDARTWYADADGDGSGGASTTRACDAPAGAVAAGGDCDDGDATVAPAAVERCDGVDDDCDGRVDEAGAVGEATWYTDADRDGYGAGGGTTACDAPAGTVSIPGDCDDARATTSPAGTEVCGGGDEDCDGLTDELASGNTVWRDADGDGLGSSDDPRDAGCETPAGFVDNGDDCDDGDADAGAPVTTYVDADEDGYGDPDSGVTSCDPAEGTLEDSTDCDDADPDVNPAAEELWYDGVDQDCDGNDADRDRDGHAVDADCADGDAAAFEDCLPVQDTAGGDGKDPAGCGCGTVPGAPPAAAFALIALAVTRRRGRQAG